jgi:hypothetical protein
MLAQNENVPFLQSENVPFLVLSREGFTDGLGEFFKRYGALLPAYGSVSMVK